MIHEIIYIGDRFYWQSGTAMSSIYEVVSKRGYDRSDWAKIQSYLSDGDEVFIRPASHLELPDFEYILSGYAPAPVTGSPTASVSPQSAPDASDGRKLDNIGGVG